MTTMQVLTLLLLGGVGGFLLSSVLTVRMLKARGLMPHNRLLDLRVGGLTQARLLAMQAGAAGLARSAGRGGLGSSPSSGNVATPLSERGGERGGPPHFDALGRPYFDDDILERSGE